MLRRIGIVVLAAAAGLAQEAALREAARLDAEGKCAEADRIYRKLLEPGRPSPALLNNLGNHHMLCGSPEQARAAFERLLALEPGHGNANLQMARLAVERREGAKALEYLARVKDTAPAVRLLRAEATHWAGKAGEARTQLAAVEKEAASDPRLLFNIGLAWARLGAYERAEGAFHRLLTARPAEFPVLYNLGRAAARAGHYERAQSALEAALKLQPEDTDALVELGLVHAARRDFNRAIFVLAQARRRAPKRADVALALARAAEDAGYWGDAAQAYDEYLALRPDDMAARRDRARVLGYTGTRLEEGLREMKWYISRFPKDPVGYFNLAQFTWRETPEESLEQLATAIRLDPNFASAHVARAWLLNRLGRAEEAVPHLEAALKIAPKDVRTLDLAGQVYLELDQPGKAEKFLREALSVSPEDHEALLKLGRALMALERDEEAREVMEKYRRVRPRRYRDPRKEPGMIELATLPEAERRRREIERFRAMAASRPDDPKLQLHLAELILADGRTEEARKEFLTLLELNAEAELIEQAGRALLRAEQPEAARPFLERAVKERPAARLDLALAVAATEGPGAALNVLGEPPAERAGDYLLLKAALLDAAGRPGEAAQVLTQGLAVAGRRADIARRAAALLVRYERLEEAITVVREARIAAPEDADLALLEAAFLGLTNRIEEADRAFRELETRRPEWDRPWLYHGLLLEPARPAEARQKIETAVALGAADPAASCALARLKRMPVPEPCACWKGLRELVTGACGAPAASNPR
jgi:tetratricopeptide (TPR) repeat protein